MEIPGSNKRERMTNAAMLYCYGSKLLSNEQVPSSKIRTVRVDHGCIGCANFSQNLPINPFPIRWIKRQKKDKAHISTEEKSQVFRVERFK